MNVTFASAIKMYLANGIFCLVNGMKRACHFFLKGSIESIQVRNIIIKKNGMKNCANFVAWKYQY